MWVIGAHIADNIVNLLQEAGVNSTASQTFCLLLFYFFFFTILSSIFLRWMLHAKSLSVLMFFFLLPNQTRLRGTLRTGPVLACFIDSNYFLHVFSISKTLHNFLLLDPILIWHASWAVISINRWAPVNQTQRELQSFETQLKINLRLEFRLTMQCYSKQGEINTSHISESM